MRAVLCRSSPSGWDARRPEVYRTWNIATGSSGGDDRPAAMFASASRALKGYNDDLSARALQQCRRLLKEAAGSLWLVVTISECVHKSSTVHHNRGATISR